MTFSRSEKTSVRRTSPCFLQCSRRLTVKNATVPSHPLSPPVFSLTEGEGVAESEAKLSSYAALNAASIAAVEARHAEEVRVLAAAELSARESGPELESVSGTAAAFAGGAHPEPQGLAYRAAAAPGTIVALQSSFPAPLREGEAAARVTRGDIVHLSGLEAQLSPEAWERMALSSGWTRGARGGGNCVVARLAFVVPILFHRFTPVLFFLSRVWTAERQARSLRDVASLQDCRFHVLVSLFPAPSARSRVLKNGHCSAVITRVASNGTLTPPWIACVPPRCPKTELGPWKLGGSPD